MKYVVAYDISETPVRVKVSRLLSRYGFRIQLSVFYLPDISEAEVDALYRNIKKLVNPRTDRVFFYPIQQVDIFEGYPFESPEVLLL
ncbi:CRISPR-associated endonuclease Cas2 [Hydrogenivirga sp. 128-5-R1-1]|uniref:CRISPR-associated endonuclease Cas2 n=1 Tax=Hydrogenivirga sp. 128-5-R1-1 TaxID=392423 RepID=UPI00015F2CA0|nr:CRISPR-associated endonuclease Cas2 [Hydrogenivirga sp. 128-5-R1-1]EDP74626.1 hypothetical protein HG1285_08411 [Hydrogenivirga sp. 128-5-R1-1]